MAGSGEEKVAVLRELALFSTLSEEELAEVAEAAELARFGAGEVVFREGEASSGCYVIRSGHAAGVREHAAGRALTLARFGPGDMFGELAMVDDGVRSATVTALDELQTIAIRGEAMRRLLRQQPERLAGQSFQTVQTRVAKALRTLVEAAREEGDAGGEIVITGTQAELARLAGSSRESASRFLAVLERAGVITQGRGRLTVHDPAALERYVY